jgi:dTDP-glucose pyrophosphorylase
MEISRPAILPPSKSVQFMSDWKEVVVSYDLPLRDAIERIDQASLQVALVLDAEGRLLGVLTDGDIRRAILKSLDLNTPTGLVMNTHATTAPLGTSREEMLAIMRRRAFHHLPLVDQDGRVAGLATLDELIGAAQKPNWVVLMAGGLGTRLHPLTKEKPKSLLHVGGKPILETIMESFIEQGFHRFYISVNYKAEMIQEHFGDGSRWGVEIAYLQETMRLGTAGALSLLPEKPTHPLIVMNGDLLTRVSFDNLLDFHREHMSLATMAVREYEHQVPYGVVRLDGTSIASIEEKPIQRHFVSAGIYALSSEALDRIPAQCFFDMPNLFENLIEAGAQTAAYPLREYWLDIGRMEEFEQAQREWQDR